MKKQNLEHLKSILNPNIQNVGQLNSELNRIANLPRFEVGDTDVFYSSFRFHDGLSFYVTFQELFEQEIYKFNPSSKARVILDCGANMGLSVLFFSHFYSSHKIIAFEPQPDIFEILSENVSTLGLNNVTLINKAVWDKEERLTFYTDHGMGGRALDAYKNQIPTYIEAIPLKNFLSDEVDFLKIDIEGAEDRVINHCLSDLHKVENIFFEYHNRINGQQTLHSLLDNISKEGFSYYIKESGVMSRPFVDKLIICEEFDMALNVFCKKKHRQAKFSIIIPTYNSQNTIKECIESILSQSHQNLEILILDNFSSDDTIKVLQEFSHKSIRVIQQKDKGVYDAMNMGIGMATGEWLFFLGSDDVFKDGDVLREINKIIHETDEVNFIYGNSFFKNLQLQYGEESSANKLLTCGNICHQAIFYRKDLFNIIGYYNLDYKAWADWDFNIRCFKHPELKPFYYDRIISVFNDYEGISKDGDSVFEKELPVFYKRERDKLLEEVNELEWRYRKGSFRLKKARKG